MSKKSNIKQRQLISAGGDDDNFEFDFRQNSNLKKAGISKFDDDDVLFASDSEELYNTDDEQEGEGGEGAENFREEFQEFESGSDNEDLRQSVRLGVPEASLPNKKRVHFEDVGDFAEEEAQEKRNKKKQKRIKLDSNANLEPIPSDAPDWKSMSSLERRQLRLQRQIEELEAENLSAKPWQMRGEIDAGHRPGNSLVEVADEVQAETAVRPPPEITADVTERLEAIIMRRIKDSAWDDVERKERPTVKQVKYSNQLALDQTKSKDSLSAIYEKEYTKQVETALALKNSAQNINQSVSALSEARQFSNPEHAEIDKQMRELFEKLDALSNYHYNPKPPIVEPTIKKINLPSIAMEETAPVAVSNDTLMAPEEVKAPINLKAATEEPTATTKRNKRKLSAKKFGERQEKLKKKSLKQQLKQSKRGGKQSGTTSLSSSTKFFQSLQNQVQKDIAKTLKKSPDERKKKHAKNSAAYKLG